MRTTNTPKPSSPTPPTPESVTYRASPAELQTVIAVYEASRDIFMSTRLDQLLPKVVQLSIEILIADDASVMLIGPDGKLGIEASAGLGDDQRKKTRIALGESVAGKVAKWKEPLLLNGDVRQQEGLKDHVVMREIRSSIVHPIMIDGEVLGVLNINRTRHIMPFTPADLRCATIFSSQVAQAVRNARLYQQLENKVHELQTAQNQIQEAHVQLVQSEKLAAIGQLAAGVAHELNNPLSGILGFAQILLESDDLTPQLREDIETIHAQSQRCRSIIQNLLTFSRRKKIQKEPVDISTLLNTTVQLVRYDFVTSGIDLVLDMQDGMAPVFGDSGQLQQVFLNLVTNARQSMEEGRGGKLEIRAVQTGKQIVTTFKDTGPGIEPGIVGKIFDPFFTTKPTGKGTGLGLSISHGIVEQHGGTLSVESEYGHGATFTVSFPIYES